MGQYNGLCFTEAQVANYRDPLALNINSNIIFLEPTAGSLDINAVSVIGLQEEAVATITFKNIGAFATRFVNSGGILTPSGTPYLVAAGAFARALLTVTESSGVYTATLQIIP